MGSCFCCLYILTLSLRRPVKIKLIIQDCNCTLRVQLSVEDVLRAVMVSSPVTVKAGQGTTSRQM